MVIIVGSQLFNLVKEILTFNLNFRKLPTFFLDCLYLLKSPNSILSKVFSIIIAKRSIELTNFLLYLKNKKVRDGKDKENHKRYRSSSISSYFW